MRPEPANLLRLLDALRDFGLDTDTVDVDDLARNARVLMIGRVPNRIDLLTQPDGMTWNDAWPRRIEVDYGDARVAILSIADLLSGKRAAGRPRDLADVATLEKLLERGRS